MQIKEILRTQGIEGKHYSSMYDDVVLSDEEVKEALYEARKKRYYKNKNQEYWDKINSITNEWIDFTQSRLYDLFLNRLFKIIGKRPTEESMQYLKLLASYYIGDENEYKQDKGFLFVGGTGTGKTALATAIAKNPLYNYEITTAKNISECYEIGEDHWQQWLNPNKAIIIDDMGDEKAAQLEYKKGQIEVIDELLKLRYKDKSYNNIVITTNMNGDSISERYGDRLRSRMREMFNIVNFGTKDLRR